MCNMVNYLKSVLSQKLESALLFTKVYLEDLFWIFKLSVFDEE